VTCFLFRVPCDDAHPVGTDVDLMLEYFAGEFRSEVEARKAGEAFALPPPLNRARWHSSSLPREEAMRFPPSDSADDDNEEALWFRGVTWYATDAWVHSVGYCFLIVVSAELFLDEYLKTEARRELERAGAWRTFWPLNLPRTTENGSENESPYDWHRHWNTEEEREKREK
jgi:hypothetical protein